MDSTDAPHAAYIAIGVAPIHLILVIQLNGNVQSFLWRASPLKNLQGMHEHTM